MPEQLNVIGVRIGRKTCNNYSKLIRLKTIQAVNHRSVHWWRKKYPESVDLFSAHDCVCEKNCNEKNFFPPFGKCGRCSQEPFARKDEEIQPTVEYKNNGSLSRKRNTRWWYLVGTRELNLKYDAFSKNSDSNHGNFSTRKLVAFLHDRSWTKSDCCDAISEMKRLKCCGIHQGTCKQVSLAGITCHEVSRMDFHATLRSELHFVSASSKCTRKHVIMSLHNDFSRKSSSLVIPGCAFRGCCSRCAKYSRSGMRMSRTDCLFVPEPSCYLFTWDEHEAQLSR